MAELVQAGAVIEVRGLTKSYGDVPAVRGIDLTVEHGQIFALLGPNGAGKTTTVEILEGYRSRDGGTVKVLGYDPARQRNRLKSQIGIVLQTSGMDRYLTVSETIAMYATFYPRPRPVDEVIELVSLEADHLDYLVHRARPRVEPRVHRDGLRHGEVPVHPARLQHDPDLALQPFPLPGRIIAEDPDRTAVA